MSDRWSGVVDPKQWMKLFREYIREKQRHWGGSGLWLMPFLIRYIKLNNSTLLPFRYQTKMFRERFLQWRANSIPNLGVGNHNFSNAYWGWSWTDRWIAARPWESRVPVQLSPKKAQGRETCKSSRTISFPITKARVSIKTISPSEKAARKAQKLSREAAEKIATRKVISKAEEAKTKEGAILS